MTLRNGWAGTIIFHNDEGYDAVSRAGRIEAGRLTHARCKFDELAKANASPMPRRSSGALRGCTGSSRKRVP